MLSYKAAWYGAELTLADRFYPSTRRCAACGAVGEALSLSERIFRCTSFEWLNKAARLVHPGGRPTLRLADNAATRAAIHKIQDAIAEAA